MYETVLFHFDDAQKALGRVETAVQKAMKDNVLRAAFYLLRAVVFESTGGTVGGAKSGERSGGIRTARGKLGQSFKADAFQSGREWVGRVGSGLRYALILETGGRIVPTQSRALTVPIDPIATRRSARDFDNLFTVKDPDTNKAFLAREDPSNPDAAPQYLYILLDHVDIPAYKYLTHAIAKSRKGIDDLLDGVIDVGIQEWGRP